MPSVHGTASLCPTATTVPIQCVSSMFTLSITEADSQPNVVRHYGQVYALPDPCLLNFLLVSVGTRPTTSQNIRYFLTPCMHLVLNLSLDGIVIDHLYSVPAEIFRHFSSFQ